MREPKNPHAGNFSRSPEARLCLRCRTLRPAEATPAMLAGAIRDVVGTAVVRTGKVKLDVPPLVENGNTVPMTVA